LLTLLNPVVCPPNPFIDLKCKPKNPHNDCSFFSFHATHNDILTPLFQRGDKKQQQPSRNYKETKKLNYQSITLMNLVKS
jgi:hypothetical protein